MFEAHSDYIRCIAVHGSQPLLLSSSDDMTIRLWDWDKQWMNTMTFEGHSHYVMMVAFNPKARRPLSSPAPLALAGLPCRAPRIIAPHWQDTNTFASASLDRTIKVPRRLPSPCSLSLSNSLAIDL